MTDQPRDALEELGRLAAALESHPDPEVRDNATALLQGIDAVHRGALTRLIDGIRGMAGESFLNRLTSDPVIRLLLMSYDLLAVDRRLLAEEALDAVRPHLESHGIHVDISEVVGGVVYIRLRGLDAPGITQEAVIHDVEEALRDGFIGFQEVVVRDKDPHAAPLIQLGGPRRGRHPVYERVLDTSQLPTGSMRTVEIDNHAILLANVDGTIYAVTDRCGDSPLPLHFGTLSAHVLCCPWHGCRYDVRSGKRVDEHGEPVLDGDRLSIFPVREEKGGILVAVGVEPVVKD